MKFVFSILKSTAMNLFDRISLSREEFFLKDRLKKVSLKKIYEKDRKIN